MPRLTPQLIRHAAQIDRHLPLLLHECRDLKSARNELRWMKEAIQAVSPQRSTTTAELRTSERVRQRRLARFVQRRARGEPLQYILGTQPFGDLEIKCRAGVLIPRPETEIYTLEVAQLVREVTAWSKHQEQLSIVDFCAGSGCIALLLHSALKPPHTSNSAIKQLKMSGFDISQHALDLSHINARHNLALHTLHEDARHEVRFEYLDVFQLAGQTPELISKALSKHTGTETPQVIISNPPYISPTKHRAGGETARSVRNFEPELALVPSDVQYFQGVERADQFYAALLKIALSTNTKLLVMEVGDTEQALRVRTLCTAGQERYVEIWRDDSTILQNCSAQSCGDVPGDEIEARAVVVWLDSEWAQWRKEKLKKVIDR